MKGIDMRKDRETKEEMERARKRKRRPDGFHGVVEAKAGLQRATPGRGTRPGAAFRRRHTARTLILAPLSGAVGTF